MRSLDRFSWTGENTLDNDVCLKANLFQTYKDLIERTTSQEEQQHREVRHADDHHVAEENMKDMMIYTLRRDKAQLVQALTRAQDERHHCEHQLHHLRRKCRELHGQVQMMSQQQKQRLALQKACVYQKERADHARMLYTQVSEKVHRLEVQLGHFLGQHVAHESIYELMTLERHLEEVLDRVRTIKVSHDDLSLWARYLKHVYVNRPSD